MTIMEVFCMLEPLILFLGTIGLLVLCAAAVLYLLKILIKPILVMAGCMSVGYLLYILILA